FNKLSAARKPLTEVEPNLFVLNPLVIPAYGSQWIRSANQKWLRFQVRRAMRQLNFENPINWVFNPAAGLVAGTLDEAAIIYYCVDEYTAFSGVSSASLAELERGLMAKADLVVVSSQPLYLKKAPANPSTVLVRHGVDVAHFRKALDIRTQL